MNSRAMRAIFIAVSLSVVGCSDDHAIPNFDDLSEQVTENRIGSDADQWIEMINLTGEWERTGLIFGYGDDYEECQKAIAGLKETNYAREYRCVPAN